MTKKIKSIKIHLSTVGEMLAFQCKEKRWASIPGLLVWSMLPLFIALFGLLVIIIVSSILI